MPHEVIHPRRLRAVLSQIEKRIYEPIANLRVDAWMTPEPVPFSARTSGTPICDIQPGDIWGHNLWDCAWFHFQGVIPESAAGCKVVLLIDVNGELCLVDDQGTPTQGLTNVNSEFDKSLGLPGKRVVHVAREATGSEVIDLWGDAGCNDLFGRYRGGTLREAQIAICHEDTRQLYYDYDVLLELADQLPDQFARKQRILQTLYDASNLLTHWTPEHVREARTLLAAELAKRGGDSSLRISAIGHAHMDLAWLWPIRETIRKGARTFATALRMMEHYPDYVFGASQPQLYQWIKDYYPRLYEQVKQRIAEGRWEVQGAMWVEPDSNVTGGESLVRQILYGKRFFQQEFGLDMKILWVPDIFGYSASLPQILKQSGVDYMMTQKLSWNQHNTHPHSSFFWEGIDGSRVLTHMPPEDTYNSPAAPRSIIKAEANYRDKNVSEHCLLVFGIGDGGGGPGEEHLERLAREKDLQGLSPVVQEPAIRFFDKLSKEAHRLKTWRGELYLERHQGTLTTQGRNKRYNRKLEKALRELEFAAVLHGVLVGDTYPRDTIDAIWKETLLYQFHDILPGSSITRVYTESLERYAVLLDQVETLTQSMYDGIAAQMNTDGLGVVFNSLPWERTEWVCVDGAWVHVTVPPMGYRVIETDDGNRHMEESVQVDARRLENKYVIVTFNDDGSIGSCYDKVHEREVIQSGEAANRLLVYEDLGDAWDFPEDYTNTEAAQLKPCEMQVRREGPNGIVEHVYRYGESELRQRIMLGPDSRRLDFETSVDWRDGGKMLRAQFPFNVHANEVSCEIQFGYLTRPTHRNTSWDHARDEICAHQWIDLSEPGYGVALLNDSKYGHRALNNVLDINLLRTPSYPDPDADRATHTFTYSIFPHPDDFVDASVYRAGYELNVPLCMSLVKGEAPGVSSDRYTALAGHSPIPVSASPQHALASAQRQHGDEFALFRVHSASVMIEAVKKAEDDDGIIVRLYETSGSNCRTTLTLGVPVRQIEQTNLMERPLATDVPIDGNDVQLNFAPFEIKTIKLYSF